MNSEEQSDREKLDRIISNLNSATDQMLSLMMEKYSLDFMTLTVEKFSKGEPLDDKEFYAIRCLTSLGFEKMIVAKKKQQDFNRDNADLDGETLV